jgi:hypothetical protein
MNTQTTSFKNVGIGQFFCIQNTKSYPKLKTEYGYIDIRDEIKKIASDLDWAFTIMSEAEVLNQLSQYGFSKLQEIEDLKTYLLNK